VARPSATAHYRIAASGKLAAATPYWAGPSMISWT
jgi:hypothetical protein